MSTSSWFVAGIGKSHELLGLVGEGLLFLLLLALLLFLSR
jgi:hypothetical protein